MKREILYKIKDIPADDRPRERLAKHGPDALSTPELIAVILGSGMKGRSVLHLAQEIVAHFGGTDKLASATVSELCAIKGLGAAKAIQLKAAFALGMRAGKVAGGQPVPIRNPAQAYHLVKEGLESQKSENFVVILLDTKGCYIDTKIISIGTLSESLVHPREVFLPAVRHSAASIILAHNHPSGDPVPSKEDIETTRRLIETGKMIGIQVNDHLIVGRAAYASIRQLGLLEF